MTKKVNLNSSEIMSAQDAAKIWGKASDYVRQMVRSNPNKFPANSVRLIGRQWVITREGMEAITGTTMPQNEKVKIATIKDGSYYESI